MPNWCSTSITFYGKDEKQIRDLHNTVVKVSKEDNPWIGNMCVIAGYSKNEVLDEACGYARGFIDGVNEVTECNDGFSFEVWVEDAWGPHIEPWRRALDILYPNNEISICWIAEEQGCEVYLKHDPMKFYEEYEYQYSAWSSDPTYCNKFKEFTEEDFACTLYDLQKLFGLKHIEDIMKRAKEIDDDLDEHDAGRLSIYEYTELDEEY